MRPFNYHRPAPGTLWRELHLGDNEPFIIDGHIIPKGTLVGVNTYSVHHNAKYFPNPFTFKPGRWLIDHDSSAPGHSKNGGNRVHEAFTPFSTGPRGCAGKAMVFMEASLIVAKMLWYFDLGQASGKLGAIGGGSVDQGPGRTRRAEYQLYDHFSTGHDGPYLVM